MTIPVVVSFDVGIKNLAICILSLDGSRIFAWNSLNLLETSQETLQVNCCMKCRKRASYFCNDSIFLCKRHAEAKDCPYFMPVTGLSQMKKSDLIQLWRTKKESLQEDNVNKAELHKKIVLCMLKPIVATKKKSASVESLIDIAKNMTTQLDVLFSTISESCEIRHVLIENQISTIAARMKTLQGMLTEYFVIKYPLCIIRYVSSSNKLATLKKTAVTGLEDGSENTYKDNKRNGIELCREKWLEGKIADSAKWLAFFESFKKRDDLADSFLQGLWFLENKCG
jgi:hypothetical protein